MFILKNRTTLLFFVFALLDAAASYAQPGNDLCGSATTITPVTSCGGISGETLYLASTTGSPTSSCGTTYDVWYSFTLPSGASNADITVTPTGGGSNLNSGNTYIELFNATACGVVSTGTSLGCNNIGSTASYSSLSSGIIYYFRVFTTTNPNTTPSSKWVFSICVAYAPPPSNDECAGAVVLSNGVTNNSGTVWLATASSGIPVGCATGDPDDDVWYRFTPSGTYTTIALTSIGSNLSSSGARLQMFTGSCGALSSYACGTTSINTPVTSGTTYYIRVYSAGTGSIGGAASGSAFSITATATTPPGNDECANAYLIPTSATCLNSRGTLVGATTSAGVPMGSCTGTPDDDVWYKFVATKTNPTISLSNIGSNLSGSSRLQLLSGSCGSNTSIACGTTSIAASGLTIGNTYYVRVYSSGSTALTSNASYNICVTDPTPEVIDSTTILFNIDTVSKLLGYPWEITYGPDDSLWVTEARGYRVLRVSSSRTEAEKNVTPQQVLKIPLGSSEVTFSRSIGTWPQGGMQGLAIHPEFMTNPSRRWVYIGYVYSGTCPPGPGSPCYFRTKIIRCQFYFAGEAGNPTSPSKDTLMILDTLISNLPGSNDHNSGRMKISPVVEGPDNTYKLYYTIGDMGAGQFNNTSRMMNAQNKDTCEGKIIRLNTEPDTDGVPGSPSHDYDKWRQWIPNDNPFTHSVFTSLRTPVYSYGHRNAQGLAWGYAGSSWRLYSSEHGDRSDDEVNIIEYGKNYGWPAVTGLADDNYTTSDDASDGFTLNNILASQTITNETTFASSNADYKNPAFSFLNWSPAQIQTINTGNIFTWPTIAPSSIDFYGSSQIPGWQNSLLVTSLKYGMFRLQLNAAGDAIDSTICTNAVDTFPLLHGWRVRDIAISPNGGYIWAVIDSTGSTSGPTGGFSGGSGGTKDGGKMLRLSYKNLSVLPVTYLSFTGKLMPDKTIRLNWDAITDQQHFYFDVEKSTRNAQFDYLGRVSTGAPYSFIDPSPNIGNNYYRLKQVDRDGSFKYSKVINVYYEPSGYIVSLYPNPVGDVISIKMMSPKADHLRFEITDMQGRTIYRENKFAGEGSMEMQINARTLAPQMYFVKITGSDNKVISIQKFVKM